MVVDATRIVAELERIGPRRACSDAERRAARLLARELRTLGRRPRIETLWVRPQWQAIWLVHALAGVAGSVVGVDAPAVGLALLAAAALSALGELSGRLPTVSLLWPRRATQNVVADGPGEAPVRLVVTAAYDAPRARTWFAAPLAGLDAALRRATGGRWPSGLGLVTLALAALAACAGARLGGIEAQWLGIVQLVPAVVVLGATALLADLAFAPVDRAPNRASSAPAAALALVDALDRRPPRRLEVDVVLAGAGGAQALGMRGYIAARRRALRPEQVAVLHLEPCGAGEPRVWRRDGPGLSLALHPQLVEAAERAGFEPYAGRGVTGALAARRARLPAVAVGRLGDGDVPPGEVEADALEDTVRRCLELVRALDAAVARRPG